MHPFSNRPPTREELLKEAATKSVYPYIQFDADHIDGTQPHDDFMLPDEEGDVITRAYRFDLQSAEDVLRVQVPKNMDKATTLRLLHKITEWVETDEGGLESLDANPNS